MSKSPPPARDQFKVWRTFTTRWADNDAYGHVNNVVFYQWFDSAVNAWLIEQEMLDIVSGDPIGLVIETRCTYAAPLAFPGDVEVGLAIADVGRSSMRYRLGVFAPGSATVAAHGEFVHVAVDRASRAPVALPEDWRRKLEAIRA